MTSFSRMISTVIILIVSLCSTPLFSETSNKGFSLDFLPSAYGEVENDLSLLITEATIKGVPSDVLLERIKEGVSKKVAPEKLLAAIKKDTADSIFILSVYKRAVPEIVDSEDITITFIINGGLILRSGISREVFSTINKKRDVAALLAVAAVHTRSPLPDSTVLNLYKALSLSSEKEERFSLLSSLFLRGRSGGMSQTQIAELIILTFNQGGTFLQLENEISRRIK